MNYNKVFIWSLVVALGGFLFGFDTAVISGAEKSIQELWSLNVFEHGLTVSIALGGTVIGALLGANPSDKYGRRKTLFVVALLYLFSALGTALAHHWMVFLTFRFLGGIGVGISSVTAPIYISEISPSDNRGKLVALFQFNVVLGILIAFLSNYIIGNDGENSWRLMLGIQALPSLLFYVLLFFVPESPRWLMSKNRETEAIAVLKQVEPLSYERVYKDIKTNLASESSDRETVAFFSKKYSRPILYVLLFAMFNQLSGINAIIYYAPRVFEMAGLGSRASLMSTVGIGVVNFIFTLIAMTLIDKFGRKTLMIIGSVGLIISLFMVSITFYNSQFDGFGVTIYLMFYIAFFAFSQGAVIWVFISEIFPNEIRAKGQTFGSFVHWAMAGLVSFIFPVFAEKIGGTNTFLFFGIMMVLQLLFVLGMMPETKGKSLEEIEKSIVRH